MVYAISVAPIFLPLPPSFRLHQPQVVPMPLSMSVGHAYIYSLAAIFPVLYFTSP